MTNCSVEPGVDVAALLETAPASALGFPVAPPATPPAVAEFDILAQGACTDSNFAHHLGLPGVFAPIADFRLLETAVAAARERGVEPPVGNILSSDVFYYKTGSGLEWAPMGVLAIDMETAGLYMNAAEAGRRALTICTVTDNLVTGEALPPAERQSSLTEMMEIALETAVRMAKR